MLSWRRNHCCHNIIIIVMMSWHHTHWHDFIIIVMTTSEFSSHLNHFHDIIYIVKRMILMPWQWFWCHDNNDYDIMTIVMSLWHYNDCCHDVMIIVVIIIVMMSWHQNCCPDFIFIVMRSYVMTMIIMTMIMGPWQWLSCVDNDYDVMMMIMTSLQ